ncbi:MAG: sodium:solute symporter family protein, partial [Planctomycetes bacterium]|nr:sodium:solute symporter family protein [Planctomycetota bacterium]
PLVVAALYWKRVTKAGAYACVLTAACVWWILFAKSGYGSGGQFLFGGMMPVATIVAASTTAMGLVSLISKPPSAETVDRFFPKRR